MGERDSARSDFRHGLLGLRLTDLHGVGTVAITNASSPAGEIRSLGQWIDMITSTLQENA